MLLESVALKREDLDEALNLIDKKRHIFDF